MVRTRRGAPARQVRGAAGSPQGPRIAALAILVSSLAAPPRPAAADEGELAPRSARIGLRSVARDLAKLGAGDELDELKGILLRLGDPPEDLERLDRSWQRDLERGGENARLRASATRKLRGEVGELEELLDELEGARRLELAAILLELDSQDAAANEALGRVRDGERWTTPAALRVREGATRVARAVQEALALDVEIAHAPSTVPILVELHGGAARSVTSHGITLHGAYEPHKLERVLRQALRAAALSNALLGGEVALPAKLRPHRFVLMTEEPHYEQALDEALEAKRISAAAVERQRSMRLRSFTDGRGWRTSRWRTEAELSALVLWEALADWLGPDAQPCLELGHLNWLCLNVFGCSAPSMTWTDSSGGEPRTRAAGGAVELETLFRAARSSLVGCRSWMERRVREGADVPWSRAMVDQQGKIQGEPLLKTTMVAELLQERGELAPLVDATRGAEDRVAAFERALERPLTEFEEEWARWLLGETAGPEPGLVQRLEGAHADAAPARPQAARLLEALNPLRARAFGERYYEVVTLAEDLCQAAESHARYLTLHEEQQRAWPDAHEEYPDREGFSPAGARAGLASVIHFVPDPVDALEGWMGTFYHRLPLLDPGLFGVGYGSDGDVVVLDVGSLVAPTGYEAWIAWPPDGARDVPLAFAPELPNPVPGEDQTAWGYPVTLQLFDPATLAEARVELSLYEGSVTEGQEPLAGHFISPQEPEFDRLAPPNAWCFIPAERLRAERTYTARATSSTHGLDLRWSFETGR
jgi:hypothetical protein